MKQFQMLGLTIATSLAVSQAFAGSLGETKASSNGVLLVDGFVGQTITVTTNGTGVCPNLTANFGNSPMVQMIQKHDFSTGPFVRTQKYDAPGDYLIKIASSDQNPEADHCGASSLMLKIRPFSQVTAFRLSADKVAANTKINITVEGTETCALPRRIVVEHRTEMGKATNVFTDVANFAAGVPWTRTASFTPKAEGYYLFSWLQPGSLASPSGDCQLGGGVKAPVLTVTPGSTITIKPTSAVMAGPAAAKPPGMNITDESAKPKANPPASNPPKSPPKPGNAEKDCKPGGKPTAGNKDCPT